MRKVLSLLVAVLLVSGMASAQTRITTETSFSLPSADGVIDVMFYDDDPFDGGELVEGQYKIGITDLATGHSINTDDHIAYVVFVVGETDLAFSTSGITHTSVPSLTVNDDEKLSILEVAHALFTADGGATQVAIFIDEDGLVSGFYEHYAGVNINVDVPEADHLILASVDGSYVYEVIDPGSKHLSTVNVHVDSGTDTLANLEVLF